MSAVQIGLDVNGETVELTVDPLSLLLEVLRDELGLTACHLGCESMTCGACTVLLDGRPVKACAVLAVQADGRAVRTVEGLADDDPVSIGFRDEHGLSCGYCTPGMKMTATALLAEHPQPDEDDIRRAVSGNLCRCTGYVNITEAIRRAAEVQRSA